MPTQGWGSQGTVPSQQLPPRKGLARHQREAPASRDLDTSGGSFCIRRAFGRNKECCGQLETARLGRQCRPAFLNHHTPRSRSLDVPHKEGKCMSEHGRNGVQALPHSLDASRQVDYQGVAANAGLVPRERRHWRVCKACCQHGVHQPRAGLPQKRSRGFGSYVSSRKPRAASCEDQARAGLAAARSYRLGRIAECSNCRGNGRLVVGDDLGNALAARRDDAGSCSWPPCHGPTLQCGHNCRA